MNKVETLTTIAKVDNHTINKEEVLSVQVTAVVLIIAIIAIGFRYINAKIKV